MNAISLMAADPAAGGSMSATLITFVLIILEKNAKAYYCESCNRVFAIYDAK